MKLLMVSHYFGSHGGGIESVAERLFRGLAGRRCEVIWAAAAVTAPPAGSCHGSSLPLRTWNWVERTTGLPFPIPCVRALGDLFSKVGHVDVVLLHDCLYLSNIAAFLRARRLGVPIVVIQHIGTVPYRSRLLRRIMKLANAAITRPMLASAQQVVFISQNTARHFATVPFGQTPLLVFNGVDTKVFRPLEEDEDKGTIREGFGVPRKGTVVLFVGRFVEKKGISAMRRMVEGRPDWTWVFAGWGPIHPGRWKANNVRVFSNLRGTALARLYRACDLLVLPSTGEGFPLVVQEALASGLPVVCSDETLAADEAMGAFARGVPVFVGDVRRTAGEFLSAIEDLNDSDAGRRTPWERHAFAASHYSWDRAAERYLKIASLLVAQRAAQATETETGTWREQT